MRAIDARNAFVMTSLLQEVTRSGTAAKAQAALKRPDIYGKTGTTNDSLDAWFAGCQQNMVGVVWMGYDTAAQARRPRDRRRPGAAGLDRLHEHGAQGRSGAGAGRRPKAWSTSAASGTTRNTRAAPASAASASKRRRRRAPSEEERKSILDLFRNKPR